MLFSFAWPKIMAAAGFIIIFGRLFFYWRFSVWPKIKIKTENIPRPIISAVFLLLQRLAGGFILGRGNFIMAALILIFDFHFCRRLKIKESAVPLPHFLYHINASAVEKSAGQSLRSCRRPLFFLFAPHFLLFILLRRLSFIGARKNNRFLAAANKRQKQRRNSRRNKEWKISRRFLIAPPIIFLAGSRLKNNNRSTVDDESSEVVGFEFYFWPGSFILAVFSIGPKI